MPRLDPRLLQDMFRTAKEPSEVRKDIGKGMLGVGLGTAALSAAMLPASIPMARLGARYALAKKIPELVASTAEALPEAVQKTLPKFTMKDLQKWLGRGDVTEAGKLSQQFNTGFVRDYLTSSRQAYAGPIGSRIRATMYKMRHGEPMNFLERNLIAPVVNKVTTKSYAPQNFILEHHLNFGSPDMKRGLQHWLWELNSHGDYYYKQIKPQVLKDYLKNYRTAPGGPNAESVVQQVRDAMEREIRLAKDKSLSGFIKRVHKPYTVINPFDPVKRTYDISLSDALMGSKHYGQQTFPVLGGTATTRGKLVQKPLQQLMHENARFGNQYSKMMNIAENIIGKGGSEDDVWRAMAKSSDPDVRMLLSKLVAHHLQAGLSSYGNLAHGSHMAGLGGLGLAGIGYGMTQPMPTALGRWREKFEKKSAAAKDLIPVVEKVLGSSKAINLEPTPSIYSQKVLKALITALNRSPAPAAQALAKRVGVLKGERWPYA